MTVTNTGIPILSGTAQQGQTMHTTDGTWTSDDPPIAYTYQWERCDALGASCVDIAGANASSYFIQAADVGHTLRSSVLATDGVSPPGPLTVDRTTMTASGGTILRNDNASASDPTSGLWGQILAVDPSRCQYITTGGDTHVQADGTPQGNTAFRRLTVVDGDDFFGERAALGRNWWQAGENAPGQTAGTMALAAEGDRKITFWSMRFPTGFPTNVNAWQQILEWKQTQPYGAGTDANRETSGSVALEVQLYGNLIHLFTWWTERWTTAVPPLNTWIRFGLDITFSQYHATGSVTMYVDNDGDGDWLDPGESFTWNGATMAYTTINQNGQSAGDTIPSFLEIGPYHSPVYGTTTLDIDNIQVYG